VNYPLKINIRGTRATTTKYKSKVSVATTALQLSHLKKQCQSFCKS